jgi:hypothetical protein
MSFFEHLSERRTRIIWSLIPAGVGLGISLYFTTNVMRLVAEERIGARIIDNVLVTESTAAPLRPLLDRMSAPTQDASGSGGDHEPDARLRPRAVRPGSGARVREGDGNWLDARRPSGGGVIMIVPMR